MITIDTWRARMSEDLRLRDYSERTQTSYLLAVRQLVEWLGRESATWTEDDIRRYFLYLREDKKASPSSINVALHGIRFFVRHTMGEDWPVLERIGVKRPCRTSITCTHRRRLHLPSCR